MSFLCSGLSSTIKTLTLPSISLLCGGGKESDHARLLAASEEEEEEEELEVEVEVELICEEVDVLLLLLSSCSEVESFDVKGIEGKDNDEEMGAQIGARGRSGGDIAASELVIGIGCETLLFGSAVDDAIVNEMEGGIERNGLIIPIFVDGEITLAEVDVDAADADELLLSVDDVAIGDSLDEDLVRMFSSCAG